MAGRRWGWRWRSMLRLRRTRGARVCSGAGGIVHVLDGVVRRDRSELELVRAELLIEIGALGERNREAQLVERALDFDFGGEVDVAKLLIIAVGSLGRDLAFFVVDVLAVGEQIDSADVNDAEDLGGLALGP